MSTEVEDFDDIIVGAGSAGCVLANRLSADPTRRVLLLEAGIADRSPLIRFPKGIALLMTGPKRAWRFPVEHGPDDHGPAGELWSRGKVLGGSSAINGMIYSRGHWRDYDDWERLGGPGWGWEDMKAAYRAIEDHELGATDYRGAGGPLHVSAGTFRYPLAEAMITAGTQLGLPRRDELNHPDLEGIGYYSHTIAKGRRVSAAQAFVHPVKSRPNLVVRTGVIADRVVFDGTRASGVACRVDGRPTVFTARGEVILAGGAIASPKLLQLSGIGDGPTLQALGIAVRHHSPLVGRNLQEHLAFSMPHRLVGAKGLNRRYRGIGRVPDMVRYGLTHKGSMATGPFEVGAFTRSTPDNDRPDIQLYFSAYSRASGKYTTEREPGFTVYGQLLRPTSLGSVTITSTDPDARLSIRANWMTTDNDRAKAVAMVRFMRSIVRQPAFEPYRGAELSPGEGAQTDDEILDVVSKKLTSGLHAVGTCAMGRDESSVVDHHLRVRGVQGLRIADCSVMPGLVSGNTNGPAMALGWRAADIILADRRA